MASLPLLLDHASKFEPKVDEKAECCTISPLLSTCPSIFKGVANTIHQMSQQQRRHHESLFFESLLSFASMRALIR